MTSKTIFRAYAKKLPSHKFLIQLLGKATIGSSAPGQCLNALIKLASNATLNCRAIHRHRTGFRHMHAAADNISVSAVIATYNSARLLPRCVNSILRQTLPVREIVIVDDGSSDGTAELVTHLPGPIRYFHQQNKGVASARNKGILEAQSQWIAFLDADDQWLPEKIERQLKVAANCPEADIIYSDAAILSENASFKGTFLEDKNFSTGHIFDELLGSCFILTSTVMAKRKALLGVGMFNEKLRQAEDYDLWLRMSLRHLFSIASESLTVYQRQSNSLTRDKVAMAESQISVMKSVLTGKLTLSQRLAARRRCASFLFDASYLVRGKNPRRAVLYAFESLHMDPLRVLNWRLCAASVWYCLILDKNT